MTDDLYRSQFRLPYSLYERLKASADANRRSVNAELVARLEETFRDDGGEETRRYISGIDKSALLETINEAPVTRKDLNDALMEAVLEVLSELKEGGYKPANPSKGPKPRNRYPKD